ncbi:hypothetical protein PHPALM_30308, partial [Phytophthora palmivora]
MQSFLGALNYYNQFIQDFAVYGAALYKLQDADFAPGGDLTVAKRSFASLQQKVMDAPILRHFDRDKEVHVMLFANDHAIPAALSGAAGEGTRLRIRAVAPSRFDEHKSHHPPKGHRARMDPNLMFSQLPRSYQGFVLSFDGSVKTEKHGGYGSWSWILWRLPEWTIVTAESAYFEATTVNLAEYAGMNSGIQAAVEHTTEDLVIGGDSRLAIQQFLG